MTRILLSGGGTGGHIYPALALARYFRKEFPDVELLYVGTQKGMEAELVPREDIAFKTLEVSGLSRKLNFSQMKTMWQFCKGLLEARSMIRNFKPDVMIGTGGYVCAPVIFMGHLMGKKTMIHEQNALPGLTNRFLSRFVDVVAVSFPDSTRHFAKAKKVVVTGNPRAGEVQNVEEERIARLREELGLDGNKKCVVVVSGSRGARPINEAVLSSLSRVMEQDHFQLVYSTGQVHYDTVMRTIEELGATRTSNIIVRPFIYDMPALWNIMDMIVCRAGATTLAEMTSSATPGILIPSPYVTNNHQEHNAKWLVEKGAAEMILEKDLSGNRLFDMVSDIIGSEAKLDSMRRKAHELGLTNALQEFTMQMRKLMDDQS